MKPYRRFKRRYTRRYRRGRTTSKLRRYAIRKFMPWKNPNKKEVKFYDIYFNGNAILTINAGTPSTTGRANCIIANSSNSDGLLQNITQSPGKGGRIGTQIFVKKISFRGFWYTCPASNATTPQDTVALRMVVANPRTYYGGTDPANFWYSPTQYCQAARFNREQYNCYYDKVYYFRPQLGIAGGSSSVGLGVSKNVRFSVPVNRIVSFTNTGGIKEDRDVFNIFAFANCQGIPDATQVLCGEYSVRIYFTDI